jgi:hypothetical protein
MSVLRIAQYHVLCCINKCFTAMWRQHSLPNLLLIRVESGSRMYIHQGGPLALQSNVQLNHGDATIDSSAIIPKLNHRQTPGLSFYNLWSLTIVVHFNTMPDWSTQVPNQQFEWPHPSVSILSAYLFVAETLGCSKSLRIANIYPGWQVNNHLAWRWICRTIGCLWFLGWQSTIQTSLSGQVCFTQSPDI